MNGEVGYGRPPDYGRFKKGVSGNPRGRPRGSKNYDRLLEGLLAKTGPNRRRGERRTSMLQRTVRKLVDNAVSNDRKAILAIYDLMQKYDNTEEPLPQEKVPDIIPLEVIREQLRREAEIAAQATADRKRTATSPFSDEGMEKSPFAEKKREGTKAEVPSLEKILGQSEWQAAEFLKRNSLHNCAQHFSALRAVLPREYLATHPITAAEEWRTDGWKEVGDKLVCLVRFFRDAKNIALYPDLYRSLYPTETVGQPSPRGSR
jgi:hypothetical protein